MIGEGGEAHVVADGLKVSTARVMLRGIMISLRSADANAADNCVWDIVHGSWILNKAVCQNGHSW